MQHVEGCREKASDLSDASCAARWTELALTTEATAAAAAVAAAGQQSSLPHPSHPQLDDLQSWTLKCNSVGRLGKMAHDQSGLGVDDTLRILWVVRDPPTLLSLPTHSHQPILHLTPLPELPEKLRFATTSNN